MEAEGRPNRARLLKYGMVMSPRVWLNARIDLAASCLFSLFNVVINQFFIAFALKEGATNAQAGLLVAAPALGLIFSPIWAGLIEKIGHAKTFVVIPNLIGRLLIIFPALFPQPEVYVATAVAFQFLMGIQAPAYAAFLPKVYPPDLRGRLMGYVRMASGVLMIPLSFGVGVWSEAAGPSGPLLAASLMGAASILLFNTMKVRKEPPRRIAAPRFNLRSQWELVRGNRALAVFLGATMFAGFGNMLANPLYQIMQVSVLDLSNTEIGLSRVAYFTALLLTYLIAGRLIDRFDIRYTLLAGIAAYAIVPMIYGFWQSFTAVMAGSFIQGVGEAIWDIGILSFIFKLAPGREGAVFSIHLLLFGIRGTIGPLLSTSELTADLPLTTLLLAASACGWIGTLLFAFGSRRKAGSTAVEKPT